MSLLLSLYIIYGTSPLAQLPPPAEHLERTKPKPQELTLETGRTIVINQFSIRGNIAISTDKIVSLLITFKNRPLNQNDLYEIKQRIMLLYRDSGRSQVEVIIPQANNPIGQALAIEINERPMNESVPR